MPYIGRDAQTAQSQNKIIDDISSSFNGSTTSFALLVGGVVPAPFPVSSQNVLISVGGVIQEPDSTGTNGYQLTGANIVFSAAPASGQSFFGVVLAGADYVNAGANFPDGDAGTPSITFSQDLDTGLFRSGSGTTSFTSNNNRIADFGTTEIVFNEDGDDINFRVEGDTEANLLFVDAGNDRIGIGTNSPETTLDIVADNTLGSSFTGSTVGQGIRVSQSSYTANNYVSLIEGTYVDSGTGADVRIAAQYTGSGSDLVFGTTSSYGQVNKEVMRMDFSGNVILGDATPAQIIAGTNSGKFYQASDSNFISCRATTAGSTHQSFLNANGAVGSITTSGSNTAFNTSSDYRLKENVVDLDGAIDRVKQLAPKRFNFIADADTTVDGFLAHEAQAIVPEAVTGTHNEVDDDGNAVMQGIDQSKLVPLLTAALQEAIAKIETLETKVAALEDAS